MPVVTPKKEWSVMIDGVNVSAGTNQEGEQILENIAIAGASAIQRLISERDDLRARMNTQQVDLVNLRTANVELRRCVISIRHHYIELATKVLAQLEQFDQATRDLMQERQDRLFGGSDEHANLVSLARRLKPAGARHTDINNLDD
jgi:hypothetical protein